MSAVDRLLSFTVKISLEAPNYILICEDVGSAIRRQMGPFGVDVVLGVGLSVCLPVPPCLCVWPGEAIRINGPRPPQSKSRVPMAAPHLVIIRRRRNGYPAVTLHYIISRATLCRSGLQSTLGLLRRLYRMEMCTPLSKLVSHHETMNLFPELFLERVEHLEYDLKPDC